MPERRAEGGVLRQLANAMRKVCHKHKAPKDADNGIKYKKEEECDNCLGETRDREGEGEGEREG